MGSLGQHQVNIYITEVPGEKGERDRKLHLRNSGWKLPNLGKETDFTVREAHEFQR